MPVDVQPDSSAVHNSHHVYDAAQSLTGGEQYDQEVAPTDCFTIDEEDETTLLNEEGGEEIAASKLRFSVASSLGFSLTSSMASSVASSTNNNMRLSMDSSTVNRCSLTSSFSLFSIDTNDDVLREVSEELD